MSMMTATYGQDSFITRPTTTKLEVGSIALHVSDGRYLQLCPMDDITPLESVRISTLLTFVSNAGATGCLYDWQAYIDLHKLQRHFKESE